MPGSTYGRTCCRRNTGTARNVRNSALASDLNSNVANPYYIGNFQSLKTSDPLLYSRLNSVSFFTSTTIPKNELLRPFSQQTNLTAANLPIRKARVHSFDATFQRRFAGGLTLSAALSLNRGDEWSTIITSMNRRRRNGCPATIRGRTG